jgi:hypothetical protein
MTTVEHGQSLLGAAIALRTALEQSGDAMAAPRLATLLESEAGLAAALAVLPRGPAQLGGAREQILLELARARQELARCRRLGASLSETLQQALAGTDGTAAYGADGRQAAEPCCPITSSRLHTRG